MLYMIHLQLGDIGVNMFPVHGVACLYPPSLTTIFELVPQFSTMDSAQSSLVILPLQAKVRSAHLMN